MHAPGQNLQYWVKWTLTSLFILQQTLGDAGDATGPGEATGSTVTVVDAQPRAAPHRILSDLPSCSLVGAAARSRRP